MGFSPKVPTTAFPVFVSTSLQFGKGIIMVATTTVDKDYNYIQYTYNWKLVTNVTTHS